MKTLALYDGNWLLWRAFSVLGAQPRAAQKMPILFLDWVCKYAVRLKAKHLAVCFDGDEPFRYAMYPEYKGKRDSHGLEVSTADDAYSHLPLIVILLQTVGIPCFQFTAYEADDVIATLTHQYANRYNKVYVVSRDKDLYQVVTDTVIVYTPEVGQQPEMMVGKEQVKDRWGVYPEKMIDLQTLMGDSVDNIPSVLGKKTALKAIVESGSLKNYVKTEKGKKVFAENEAQLKMNRQLVKLKVDCPELMGLNVNEDLCPTLPKDIKQTVAGLNILLPKSFSEFLVSLTAKESSLFG